MSDEKSDGMGFFGVLCLIFITLKLCNVINWSWWFVMMPLYGVAVFLIVLYIIVFLIGCVID